MINYESGKKMFDKPSVNWLPKENKQSRYSAEFKREVVKRCRETKNIGATAKSFNIAHNTLRAWINEV